MAFGNGIFVGSRSNNEYYTSTDGDTWTSRTFPNNFSGNLSAFGNGVFVVTPGAVSNVLLYSSDGINWNEATSPVTGSIRSISFGNGYFIATIANSSTYIISSDGINWSSFTNLPSSGYWNVRGGSNNFVAVQNGATCYSSGSPKSYFLTDQTPTTSSIVYSAPEVATALTITSASSSSITLSDNDTCSYNSSGNQFTYRTIGDAHPNWVCNINEVGVKIGNTMIADNTVPVSSVDSSSTNDDTVGAKLFYDTCGDIETLINAL
jgi:hypothetical protein